MRSNIDKDDDAPRDAIADAGDCDRYTVDGQPLVSRDVYFQRVEQALWPSTFLTPLK